MDNKPLNRIKVVMAERMVSNKSLGEMLSKESLIEIAKALKWDIGDLVRMDDSMIVKEQD